MVTIAFLGSSKQRALNGDIPSSPPFVIATLATWRADLVQAARSGVPGRPSSAGTGRSGDAISMVTGA